MHLLGNLFVGHPLHHMPLQHPAVGLGARVLIEAARSRPDSWNVVGFVDVEPGEETARRMGIPRLGSDDEGPRMAQAGAAHFALGIAGLNSLNTRARLAEAYDKAGARWGTIVHATAWISPTARLDDGVFVSAGAIVNSGARIERHSVINTGAVIEHDVVIGEFAQVAPGAVIGGGSRVGGRSYVGLGASVRDHIEIGEAAVVGMGAVVVEPVPAGGRVIGNPARPQRTLPR